MTEIRDGRPDVLSEISEKLAGLSPEELFEKRKIIEKNLMEFANFMESKTALLYSERSSEIPMETIIRECLEIKKEIVLPLISNSKHSMNLLKINDYDKDLVKRKLKLNVLEPDPGKCKKISIDQIDIAVIPGLAFDEKGGRLGFGEGFYNRLIPKLPETTRKISIAFEEQIAKHIQMDSRKYSVDIIITDKRVIYRI